MQSVFFCFSLQERTPFCFVIVLWFCWTVPLWKKPERTAGEALTHPQLILLLLNAVNYLAKLQGGTAVLSGDLLPPSSFNSHSVQGYRLISDWVPAPKSSILLDPDI